MDKFLFALSQDLNIPNALSVLFDLMKKANVTLRDSSLNINQLQLYFYTMKDMLNILGLNIEYPILDSDDIVLYLNYLAAKEERNFALSDCIRNKLSEKGIL